MRAVLCCLIFLVGFLGCSKKAGPPPPPIASSNDAVSVFTLVGHSDNGRKKWEVQGETADLLGEIVQLSPVTARSFGDVEVKLTANRGRYQKTTQDIYLQKNVVVTTSDGGRLTTESLQWWHERDMARTLDWLNISRPGMTVLGIGGVGFPKLKRARVERKITVTLQGEEGQTVVTCDGPMEVDYVQHKARFWRNVLVRDAQGFIRSDRLDVLLTSETNQIQEARFWGHVQIHRGNQRATAQRANYWGSPKRTRLTGHTRMVMLPQDNEQ